VRRLAPFLLLLAAATGWGGGGSAESTTAPQTVPAVTGTVSAPASTAPSPETVTGILPEAKPQTPFIARLTATGHRPVAGEEWTFEVNAKNKDGSPTAGTVRAILLLNGKVYDTIGWFGFSGNLKHSVTFPLERKDLPLTFQAQVIANGGVRNLDYPLKVQ
jgi:hypothetical protein